MTNFTPYNELAIEDKTQVDSEFWAERFKMAVSGKGWDKLIDDPEFAIRWVLAFKGYGLDRLIDDPNSLVRSAVVEQGYGLDKLWDDPDRNISRNARKYVYERYGYGVLALGDWIEENPDKCVLPINKSIA